MTNENSEMPNRIEFRLRLSETDFLKRLMEQARRFNRCPNEQAREILKEALTAPEHLQHAIESLQQDVAQILQQLRVLGSIKDSIRTLHDNIYQLRDDLAACIEKLLVDAGQVPAETAEQWVAETFKIE